MVFRGNLRRWIGEGGGRFESNSGWLYEHIHPNDLPVLRGRLNDFLEGSQSSWHEQFRFRQPDGFYAVVASRGTVIRNKAGRATNMIGGLTDITALHIAQEQLAFDAMHDELTRLPNRRFFRDRLARVLSGKAANPLPVAVLFVDLDRFKAVNDSLGHTAGDYLLQAVSERMRNSLEPGELVARFGADEFTVLIENASSVTDATRVAERIHSCLAAPFELGEHSVVVTASIGIALARADATPDELLQHADVAMYRAKARGPATFEVFESGRDAPRMRLVQLESEIRRAMLKEEFRVYYQPIVTLPSGQVRGVEALIRWQHPERGLLPPAEFLSTAEECGAIVELGNWVLKTACRDLSRWRTAERSAQRLYISVNLARQQMLEPELSVLAATCLKQNGLTTNDLVLEVTEDVMFENNEAAATQMREWRDMGLRFALDDFGKGYSSLARVHELPISILKVDGSFVEAISQGRPALADAAVALARTLDLEIVAEYVETESQAAYLSRAGYTAAQGHYFSAPLAAERLLRWMSSQARLHAYRASVS